MRAETLDWKAKIVSLLHRHKAAKLVSRYVHVLEKKKVLMNLICHWRTSAVGSPTELHCTKVLVASYTPPHIISDSNNHLTLRIPILIEGSKYSLQTLQHPLYVMVCMYPSFCNFSYLSSRDKRKYTVTYTDFLVLNIYSVNGIEFPVQGSIFFCRMKLICHCIWQLWVLFARYMIFWSFINFVICRRFYE